jgi:peptide/nickel transport system permease protein
MWQYLLRRVFYMIFTVWVISIISFTVIQLPPGDYTDVIVQRLNASGGASMAPQLKQQLQEEYGLDQPIFVQYAKWLGNIITKGQFGFSFTYLKDAREIIFERLPMTFAITLFAVIFIWLVALPVGIYSAVNKYSLGDYLATFIAFVGLAVPSFLIAMLLMYLSQRYTGKAVIGLFSPEYASAPWSLEKVWDLIKHLWIPAIVIGLGGTAGLSGTAALIRTMRANLLDELNKPYVETARSKGLSERRLLFKYPVRYALNPFIATIGWILPSLVAGEVIVSIVLNLPTSGPVLLDALRNEDMYVASGFILVLSTLTVVGTFISDVLLAWLDPRIRLVQSSS